MRTHPEHALNERMLCHAVLEWCSMAYFPVCVQTFSIASDSSSRATTEPTVRVPT